MSNLTAWPIRWWLGGFAGAVALPLFLLLGWIFLGEIGRERQEARNAGLVMARTAGERLRKVNADSLALLDRLSQRPGIQQFDGRSCDSIFELADFFPQFANLLLIDDRGQVLCSATPVHTKDQVIAAEGLRWVLAELGARKVVPRKLMIRSIEGHWVCAIAVPWRTSDGVSHGVLALLQVPELVDLHAEPNGSAVTVVDAGGTILARSGAGQWVGRSIRGTQLSRMSATITSGTGSAVGIDGVSREFGFTFLPELQWWVYAGLPRSEVMRPVTELYLRGAVTGGVALLLVILVAMVRSRSIQRPVDALARAAETVANGGYGTVNVSEGPREIVRLGAAFNEMVASRAKAQHQTQEGQRNLRTVSDRLLVVQEHERTRIARELHDDFGQSLTALKMDVIGLLNMTPETAALVPLRKRILGTLDQTVTSVQRISAELRPGALEDLGLISAIESEARLFEERTGIECEISLPTGEDPRIDMSTATAIFRIMQESLTNVARHSNAARVEVRLRHRADEVLLEVRDDGRGVTEEELQSVASLGLIGIRERSAMAGGTVRFEGIAGRGTIVSVRIPLSIPAGDST